MKDKIRMINKTKMLGSPLVKQKVVKQSKKVYECLHCGRKQIGISKPDVCVCNHDGEYVVNASLIVTK